MAFALRRSQPGKFWMHQAFLPQLQEPGRFENLFALK